MNAHTDIPDNWHYLFVCLLQVLLRDYTAFRIGRRSTVLNILNRQNDRHTMLPSTYQRRVDNELAQMEVDIQTWAADLAEILGITTAETFRQFANFDFSIAESRRLTSAMEEVSPFYAPSSEEGY